MKRQLLLGSVLLAAISAYSQTGRVKPKPTGVYNAKSAVELKFNEPINIGPITTPPASTSSDEGSKSAALPNTWNNFTASMNIYGVSIVFTKPLQWNDELNAVSFIHRKSPSYLISPAPASAAETGGIVAMISSDCGATWDSTALYADDSYWGRYPQGAIYNPPTTPTNTDISQAHVVGCGPTTGQGSATWIGNWFASKQLGVVNYDNQIPSGSSVYYPTLGPYPTGMTRVDFAAYSFNATDDGKVRAMGGLTDDAVTQDSAIVMVTGRFNSANNNFDWTDTVFNTHSTIASDGSHNFWSRPLMAWNESGTIGYVVVMSSRKGATMSNTGYIPLVYRTTNSGASWTLDNTGIDFNSPSLAYIKKSLNTVNMDSTLEVPMFNWSEGYDATVDMNGKLHIFTTITGHYSNDVDSLNFYTTFGTEKYRWLERPGFRPYLYDFMYDGTTWTHMLVDSMPTEGPGDRTTDGGYADNPWDPDPSSSNNKIRLDGRLQLSRTPDGKYVVYTWTETDTVLVTGYRKWNVYPNIKARVYDASTGTLHPTELNVTNPSSGPTAPNTVKNRCMFFIASPKCRVSGTSANGPAISIPVTVSNSSPYSQLSKNTHWFSWATLNFGGIADANITPCGSSVVNPTVTAVAENAFNSAASAVLFPNPAKNNTTVRLNLLHGSKVQIEVMNSVGQIVKLVNANGQNGQNSVTVDLSGLASGIYMVNVKVNDASSTKKLIIE
ncbi:MAG: T9SS type A sorting domain-containing protein [Bacteroidia bacterium]|nr:T9SS type A sorting domain-containing protein [Bacteroidia bacterium]